MTRNRITSIQNPLAQEVRALRDRKVRAATGRFLIEGPKLIAEALAAGVELVESLVAPGFTDQAPAVRDALERSPATRVTEVPDALLDRIAAVEAHQGIIAVARQPPGDLAAVVARAAGDGGAAGGVLLVADSLQDPGNLGALVRVAEALSATGLVVAGRSVDPWNPKAVRAAAGSLFRLPIATATDDQELVGLLARAGLRLVAAAAHGGAAPSAALLKPPVALVVGSEAHGVGGKLLTAAAERVTLPIAQPPESLNVVAAAALLLYEARRAVATGASGDLGRSPARPVT